ncbi:MAG: S8 family serine peptidase, partial [Gaiellales bacterium]
ELDALTYATDRGVLIVAASGNGDSSGRGMNNDSPTTPDYPSGYDLPGILSVTSNTRSGVWSTWANYGATTVDVAAPGENILVAAANGGGHRSVSGTSFAAPHAAGVAALVAASSPGIAPTDVQARIMQGLAASPSFAGRTVTGGIINAQSALASNVTGGGGGAGAAASAPVTRPKALQPRRGARIVAPPTLTWELPPGWRSQQVRITGPGTSVSQRVSASSRSLAHPRSAWRSGMYRWQVVARTPQGARRITSRSSYRISTRLGAWVTSGRLKSGGRSARLRVGYASSAGTAKVRVRILHGKRLVHSGRTVTRRQHVKGRGLPPRGWFAYDAKLTGAALRVGAKVTVEVRVTSGGTTMTRRFRAAVR